ncbi:MAG: GreA/GreB family elongation factor [Anaerolineae bacterium]|jgi:transcription elongation factor GreA|nr:GreA/GreB family elongation factor [Anaerolineae bacterium]
MAISQDKFVVTPDGLRKLQSELQYAQQQFEDAREQMADSRATAVGRDDHPDVGVEWESRTRLEHWGERMMHLQYILDRAEVITDDPNPTRIDPGERITLWDFDAKEEIQFDLLSSAEAVEGFDIGEGDVTDVSIESPVGKALLGKQVGDIIEVEIPDGKARYAIRKIERIR